MLAVDRWEIHYADGSTFTSEDGSWAEAPAFGVFAVVYYHPDGYRTIQKEQYDQSIYRWLPDVDGAVEVEGDAVGAHVKFGLWVHNDQYLMLFDRVHGMIAP